MPIVPFTIVRYCLQTLPNVPKTQNHPQLRTTDLQYGYQKDEYFILFYFISILFYCSSIVVSMFLPPLPPSPPIPTSHPQTHPLELFPCVPYTCSLMVLPLFPPLSLSPSLLVTVNLLFQCLWFSFARLFLLLIRFHLQVRSYDICLSPPGLFHLA